MRYSRPSAVAVLLVVVCAFVLSGCGGSNPSVSKSNKSYERWRTEVRLVILELEQAEDDFYRSTRGGLRNGRYGDAFGRAADVFYQCGRRLERAGRPPPYRYFQDGMRLLSKVCVALEPVFERSTKGDIVGARVYLREADRLLTEAVGTLRRTCRMGCGYEIERWRP